MKYLIKHFYFQNVSSLNQKIITILLETKTQYMIPIVLFNLKKILSLL